MKTSSIAVIGSGYFSQFHLDAWARMADASLDALVTNDPEQGRSVAEESGIPAVYGSVQAMLAEMTPDVVDIVTPPTTHLDLIRQIAPAGCAIQCQKPFCGTIDAAREAVEIARTNGATLAVHENFRFQPWHREIARQIESGALGTVYQATFRLRPGDGKGDEAYLERQPYFRDMPRFLIHETAIHQIDLFRFLFGEPLGLFAKLDRRNPVIAGEDSGIVVFDFADDVRAVFDGNRLVDHQTDNPRRTMGELMIEGSEAVLRLDGSARLWLRQAGATDETELTYEWSDHGFGGDCVYEASRAFLSHVRDGGPLENDATTYLRNLEIVDAVYRSADAKAWIDLDQ